jgi:ABC-type lipoprotein release transport system permease subunit
MQPLLQAVRCSMTTSNPGTFLFVASLLMVIALAACYIPGRRAARVAPMVVSRYE